MRHSEFPNEVEQHSVSLSKVQMFKDTGAFSFNENRRGLFSQVLKFFWNICLRSGYLDPYVHEYYVEVKRYGNLQSKTLHTTILNAINQMTRVSKVKEVVMGWDVFEELTGNKESKDFVNFRMGPVHEGMSYD